jgi:hypothetical protein
MEIFMETSFLAETDAVVNLHSGLWCLASGHWSLVSIHWFQVSGVRLLDPLYSILDT